MGVVENIITDNLPIWSSTVQKKSSAGRGTSSKQKLYGVKKLRELILDLAVRGLLVPQDPNDEAASVLLEKIAVAKKTLMKEGKAKKQKIQPLAGDDLEGYFKLPSSWCWIELSKIGHDWGQKKPDIEFTYIDVGAINKELGLVRDYNVLDPSDAPSRARKIIKRGTVIYSTVRPYLLNIAVIKNDIEPEPIASTAFAIIHPYEGISSSYIYRYLRSPAFITYVESCQTGIAYPAINDKQFFSGVIPLPPSAEQHRIVAKVDELMALCDTLEQQQEDSIQAHETLVKALLEALTSAIDADAFQSAWKRISKHFDVLFTTEHSIDKLKETILQLAVMGKLVPQDHNDEPASVLLEKVAAEKDQLVKRKVIQKRKNSLLPIDAELPYKTPDGWLFTRLSDSYYTISPGKNKLKTSEVLGEGKYPVVDQGLKFVSGFTNSGELLISIPHPVVVFGDHTRNIKLIDFDFVAGADGTKILVPILINAQYFYTYCLSLRVESRGYGRHFKAFNDNFLALPPLGEQHRIVAKVDELMALCDQLKESLQQAQQTQIHLTDAVVENAL